MSVSDRSAHFTNAQLSWDAAGLPHSLDYGDIYYSQADALGESTHVFLSGNRLHERFKTLQNQDFVIGELGFGAGLNFLNTCRLWCESTPPTARLHYVACEMHPFTSADLARMWTRFPTLQRFSASLLAIYPDHTQGVHQLELVFSSHRIVLSLLYGDALSTLAAYIGEPADFGVDAWFLDGFSPKVNKALWQLPLLQLLARNSHEGTTLATYSVAGSLRNSLTAAGCEIAKSTGFGGKRHMLKGKFNRKAHRATASTMRTVCIVGGGLSGCSTAHALANSSWRVILLEQADTLATAASGNLQAVLHCKPGTADSIDNQFNLHAYLHASRHYETLQKQGLAWHRCGMLHVGTDADQLRRFERILQSGRFSPAVLQLLEKAAASAVAGIELQHACLHFPLSGWLNPAELCRFYTNHPQIEVRTNVRAMAVEQRAGSWQLQCSDARAQIADAVVLCNAGDLFDFPQCRHLPLISNRGQVDLYNSASTSELKTILCGQGYLTPADRGQQSLGGSYYVEQCSTEHNRLLHLQLLQRMDTNLAQCLAEQRPVLQRVGQRCQTPDRMPLVGELSADSPGLYVNAAHGSNGLARTPIAASLLAAIMNRTPAPLTPKMRALLNPARFVR